MHKITVLFTLALLAASAFAQQAASLATSTVRNFTVDDLSTQARSTWEQRDRAYAAARSQLLSQMVVDIVLELEAKSRNTAAERLVAEQKNKITDPTETEIKATYDANVAALGDKPLNEVRDAIVQFLRRDPEERALKSYVDELAGKYGISYQNDVNKPGIKSGDVLFTVGGRTVTAKEFEDKYRLTLYDVRADLADDVQADLETSILNALSSAEAALLKVDQQAYLAREITDKMREASDEERGRLVQDLRQRLFTKYRVKILIDHPRPIVQKIAVDDDPARGPLNSPVTVVMFGDFQCSVCARMHPVLQKVINEFPGKVRFVARDFPLESIHKNAFRAALAAGAANSQGKFFEFGELLYQHQDALDDESLKKYAAQAGLNVRQFEIDLNAEKTAAEVRKDIADGVSYGVNGTPTIFVNGVKVRRLSADDFREAISNAMRPAAAAPARPAR